MYGLPISTMRKQQLPKKAIYAKFDLKPAQRDSFDADMARLDIVAVVSPVTVPALSEGTEVKAIFVVEVKLKRLNYNVKNMALIAKLIPQRIIFALRFDEKVQLAAYHTKFLAGKWQSADTVGIPLVGLNLDAVWQNMVVSIGDMEIAEGNTLAEQIRADDERAKLLSRIEKLERQMRATSQKHKQRELYAEIKKLKGLIV